ncbi:EAL domain-containing protein [Thermodesulfatator atlanticus]|uniref:EAL domain-containing protein n=1 Tax=Thermodesulfatator atlanticus TaxID=501497 RepID=UPI0003B4D5BB|nr:EAL domain-containing protein [Thermodesulfatator atlanticus]
MTCKKLAEKIYNTLHGPLPIKGSCLPVKVSIFVSRIFHNTDIEEVLDTSIYNIENNNIEEKYLTEELRKENETKQILATYLKISRKITIGEISFALQPIYYSKRLFPIFYEVLARLASKKGILTPSHFMKIIERLGFRTDLDRVILYKALYYLSEHKELSATSINISIDYLFERLLLDLKQYLKEFSIDKNKVIFELIEHPSQQKFSRKKLYKFLDKLKSQGFKIALDDFGLYHSNFSLLKEFPWDIVKVDGTFIKHITTNNFNKKLLHFLIEIAEMKNFKIVAEHIETNEQAELLKKLGVHYLQGFLLGRPSLIHESQKIVPPLLYNFPDY